MYTTELINAITGEVLASKKTKHKTLAAARKQVKYYDRYKFRGGINPHHANYHEQMVIKDADGNEVERHLCLEVRSKEEVIAYTSKDKEAGVEVLGKWYTQRKVEWFKVDKEKALELAQRTHLVQTVEPAVRVTEVTL
jgi:hypothetical protein